MFDNLSDRLQGIFSGLRGKGRLTEDDINSAMREVRMAMLEPTSTSRWSSSSWRAPRSAA
mgnify:CR=1 FL=1